MEEKFIEYMENQGLSENTCSSYANDLRIFKEYYINSYGEELKELIHADVKMYISYLLKNNIGIASINRKIAALKSYNLFLVDQRIQENVVILDKDYIKVQQNMILKKIPQEQEINKLKHISSKDKKHGKRDYCVIVLLSCGGFRANELVNLRLVDIFLDERFINVLGKGNKFRRVIINNLMYDALVDYLEERNSMKTDNPYLFVSQKNMYNTKSYNRNFCNRVLDKYKDVCKSVKLHPHLLRALFCTNALHKAGYEINQVADQAGHGSLNTTKKYLVSDREDLISLANKL